MKSSPQLLSLRAVSYIKKKVEWRDLAIFAIPLVFFSVALLAFWPGLYTGDGLDQYKQAQTGIVYTAHPVFHTFTIWLINKLHHSEAMLPALQILTFSTIWAIICRYFRQLYEKDLFTIQVIFTVTLCFLPVIYTYAIGAWKDVLYSYCLLTLALLIFIGSNKKFNYSLPQLFCISILLALTTAYRLNGAVSALVILIALSAAMAKYKVAIKKMILLAGCTLVFYTLTVFVPHAFLEIHTSPGNPKTSVAMFYMASFVNSGVKIDPQDQRLLYKIMPRKYWLTDYYQYSYVTVDFGGHINKALAYKSSDKLFDMMLKYDLRYPGVAAEHFFEVNNMAWDVAWPLNGPYKTTPAINAMPLSEKSLVGNAYLSKLHFINKEMRLNIDYTLDSAIMQTIFYRPALYMYLSIALVATLVVKTRRKSYWLILVPMLSNLPAILVFGLTQDMRYLYINVLTFFFVAILAISFRSSMSATQK